MQIIKKIQSLFQAPLKELFQANSVANMEDQLARSLGMIRPAQNASFGDYQANFAMPLKGVLGMPPREIAEKVVAEADLESICSKVEVAGPGFINMTLSDDFLLEHASVALADQNLGVTPPETKKKVIVDYSSPNVAKPMHVGHIRSTVIGDALAKIHRALGHEVIADNHLGDWGTQFGMIIYGYRNFGNQDDFQAAPVAELSRIYRLVRKIMDVLSKRASVPKLEAEIAELKSELDPAKELLEKAKEGGEKKAIKSAKSKVNDLNKKIEDRSETLQKACEFLEEAGIDKKLMTQVADHPEIAQKVLEETSKLHAGDQGNLDFWKQILPHCHDEIDRVYSRLEISFDHAYGESFYHDQLKPLVDDMIERKLAVESDGAICVFVDGFDAPMIVRKRDGAFLYATTDLATIEFRMTTWNPDVVLYVVDHRQSEHFDKLFKVGAMMGYESVNLFHVSFGTVMGKDGKPFQTRAGDTVGLEGLINEAVAKAHVVVSELDDKKPEPEFDAQKRKEISEVIGTGALKFGDLSQNRTSDYKFDFDKMVALEGDTATYVQYAYTRVNGIFSKVGTDMEKAEGLSAEIMLNHPLERALIVEVLRFQDALEEVLVDYRPNLLCSYLVGLARAFSSFYNSKECRVKDVEEALQGSRLKMCVLTSKTLQYGLSLLGIGVVEKM